MYSLAHRSREDGSPIIRPLFHDFPDDPRAYDDQDAMMLGPDVLFSPVVEGARSARRSTCRRVRKAGWSTIPARCIRLGPS